MDKHKTMALNGEKNLRYSDVFSFEDCITMMMFNSEEPTACLETTIEFFKKAENNYPIRGLPEVIPSVKYRTRPDAWMDKRVFLDV